MGLLKARVQEKKDGDWSRKREIGNWVIGGGKGGAVTFFLRWNCAFMSTKLYIIV